jgi:hypothetical protein
MSEKKEEVVTHCAILYNEEREKASKAKSYVPAGMLKKIVQEEEEKAGLESNSISLETIRSRVKRHTVSAYNPFETPLIAEVEPLMCQFCIRLGKMGQPLTKKTIIEFANSIISKTEYQDKVEAAKKLRGLEDESKLGVRWYQGFLSRHASLIKHRDVPKFEPTVIVPLTNSAFSQSFGNSASAKKAIEARGWNLLNYYLLTVLPGIKQDVVDLTVDNQQNKENEVPLPPLPRVNVTQGIGNYYVNLLIQ